MKSLRKKLALVVASAVLLTACAGGGASQEAKKGGSDQLIFGGILPKTGDAAIYGNTTNQGIELAINEINEAGGILGKKITYVSHDDKGDPTDAVNVYNKLMDEGAAAIVGAITSKPSVAVANTATSDGVPVVTPTGTQLDITEGKPNVFRACFTDPFQGLLLATFAHDSLKAKNVAILRNNSSDYSKGVADEFIKEAKKMGMNIVADEGYSDTDNDFKAQLTSIQSKNPDVLLVPDYYEKIALIAPQARQAGLTATFIGGDGWDGISKVLDPSSYPDIENSYFTNHFSLQDQSEKVQNFIKAYKAKYNEDPSAFSALGYDAVYILKEAMEKANTTDYDAVTKAMKDLDFDGVTGKLSFDENNNPVKAGTIIKIVNGEYTFDSKVEPSK